MPKSDPIESVPGTPSSAVLQGALAIGVLSVSSSAVLIRLVPAPASAIAFWRLLIAILILAPGLLRQRPLIAKLKQHAWLLTASGGFLALHFLTWIQSLSLIPVAASTALVSCHPIFVAGYERLVHQKPLARGTIIGGILVFLGLVAVTASAHFQVKSLWGAALALLGALFAAAYLLVGQRARQSLHTTLYAPSIYTVALILLAGVQLTQFHGLGPLNLRILILYVLMALLPTIGGHTLFNWLLRYMPASTVSLAFLGEIAGSALLAWLILGQVPPVAAMLGIAAILAGLFIAVRHTTAS